MQWVKVDLYNWWDEGSSFFVTLCCLYTHVHFKYITFLSPGESRLWGEPDRCCCGDVGHQHVGGSTLQPD